MNLRPYQSEVIAAARREIASGRRRPLIVAPTGAGKTIIAAKIADGAVAKGRRVLFLAHRRELIAQAADKLWTSGRIESAILMAGYPSRPQCPVQVASVQTLWARAHRSEAISRPEADVVIVDEAHRARSRTYQEILDSYPHAVILGLTATPCRSDGRGLGNVFDALVQCPPVADLTAQGYLVPTVVYAPSEPDLAGVRIARGDYVERELAARSDTPVLVGDIVEHWLRLAEGRKTVVFGASVAHSVHIRDAFRAAGIAAEHIDGRTPADERDAILRAQSRGDVTVVCNCMVLAEGWDQPDVSCCVIARATKNMGLYRQMAGRVLRPWPGKTDALILDHAGVTREHGFVDEPVEWTLDVDSRAVSAVADRRQREPSERLRACPQCTAIRTAGEACRVCGWAPSVRGQAVEVVDGDLVRHERGQKAQKREWSMAEKQAMYSELLSYCRDKGYRPGWAANKYREKFGVWPRGLSDEPIPPSPATLAWIRSRQIAWAKRNAAA